MRSTNNTHVNRTNNLHGSTFYFGFRTSFTRIRLRKVQHVLTYFFEVQYARLHVKGNSYKSIGLINFARLPCKEATVTIYQILI